MTGRVVNVALIGAGEMGQFHAETLAQRLPDARLAAVVDPARPDAERAAALADGAFVAARADDVLCNEAIDAVVIAAPTRFHGSLIAEAARHGKHVFCEKPIALTLEEACAALDAVAASGVKLQMGFQRRFDEGYVRARRAVERGDIGAIELLSSTTRDPEPPAPGYLESCGGAFLDTAIHDFDSIRFLSGGEVVEVYAAGATLVTPDRRGPFDIDTLVTVLRLESGALATVTNSLRTAYGYEAGAEVFGSKGKLVIGAGLDAGVEAYGPHGVATAYPRSYRERFGAAYRAELADFVRCVIEDAAPKVNGDDGMQALKIALAATRSQREGCLVRV